MLNVLKESLRRLAQRLHLRENVLDYICGSEALPLPYSAEEESALLGKLSAGDAAVRSSLIEHNLRLVVYIARKFDNTGADADDLVSVGTIGLIKAVNSFDPAKNIKLATYASRCIENEILMYLRRLVRVRNEVSFDEPLNTDWEGNELLLSDILGTDSDVVYKDIETGVEKELLRGALRRLPERDRRIMTMRFGLDGKEEMTQKDVADVLGISQSYISRLEKKIIARLKSEIGKLV
ncbi:MAG TPA: RNA polymerase sporulation sigma factor SigE [Candidatus Borkfalkia faecigallinarum]|uniref:RNA polymerase sigma factor n=1 Tax=Candidatus Borkfalkia faecigallinarum TaxID=2838509 RepID=A0A9D1VTJ5_9FIRM|nr:RNA polymerase sporulation sigma factor SigE [Candidatus Borkfalkia faecigallinarum]